MVLLGKVNKEETTPCRAVNKTVYFCVYGALNGIDYNVFTLINTLVVGTTSTTLILTLI